MGAPADGPAGSGAGNHWMCLVVHDVQPAAAGTGGGPERFSVSLRGFERLLDAIAAAGYRGCSLAEAVSTPGTRRVAITFDDGDRGQYEFGLPALLERGMTATFFITTDWVGRTGYVTWRELREMTAHGMSIQSHTCSHPFLSELDAAGVRAELRDSKDALDNALGQDTSEIAFPGGDPPARHLTHMLAETGYRVAAGSRWGRNDDTLRARGTSSFVRRCTVRGDLSALTARRLLAADPRLAAGWVAKETLLRRLRTTLGASRYARWRRFVLDTANRING